MAVSLSSSDAVRDIGRGFCQRTCMIQNPRETKEDRESESPSREELASAHDVILAMVRAAKGLRMYLPNNPVLIKFIDDLSARMLLHISRFGDFRLQVDRFALRYQGADVYLNQDPKESIAFRLYADGVRALLFAHGVEPQELVTFLDIIGFERPNQQDDDIVTQLWEKNLPHVNYLLQEDFVEVGWIEEQPSEDSQQEALSRISAFIAQNSPLPPRVVSKHLLMLTGAEASWLRQAKQAETQRNPLNDVIDILSAILAGAKDPALFDEFLEIMTKLTIDMFLVGEIGQALRLVRFLNQLTNEESLAPDQRQKVTALLTGMLSDQTVRVLQETLDAGDSVSHEELRDLLQIFGIPSLRAICELLGRVEKLKMRKVIIEVLVELGSNDPKVFAPFLADPRWYLVRNVVLVLSLLGSPEALEIIVGLITHKEARIRKEVLGFLERSPDPKAKAYILKYFRDESSALRIKALQILAREKQLFALKPALALTTADDFRTKELAEKKAIYETIGELGSESSIPLFREMLLKKSWFQKTVDKESAICAVAGLLKMKSSAALQLLEEARKQKNLEVREIINQAISAITAGQGRAVPGPDEV
jgi:HEAT repeat protein